MQVPVVTLVKAGDSVFGGYGTEPWVARDECYGQPGCFLFNITANTKIPYHGRCAGTGRSSEKRWFSCNNQCYRLVQFISLFLLLFLNLAICRTSHECLYASEQSLSFGREDFVLSEDFTSCTSQLEQCYGIGLQPDSHDAKVFLGGSSSISADDVEVWAMY